MKMFLFLNEACIFIDSVCEGIVFWGLCLFVCAECENANYRGAEVPYKTLFRACDTSFFWYSRMSEFSCYRSSFRSVLLSLSPVYPKRSPRKNNTVPSYFPELYRIVGMCWESYIVRVCNFYARLVDSLIRLRYSKPSQSKLC
ncbi:AGA_1a_G0022780.mRNA.1.CDS.1 [Saccharomyces cerevisiae]|nr:AGA_1a_G0022780.mRNA.1.CDS.1 [Saccharomyces cerevisiae]CAI6697148.1 AGA_1a_G0022780.mRNA.1.CDS.1 [Saccharomyces cerevisiae]